jgi:hypothetical protein
MNRPRGIDPASDQPQAVVAFIHNPVFHTDELFIRMENRVGARSAQ